MAPHILSTMPPSSEASRENQLYNLSGNVPKEDKDVREGTFSGGSGVGG